MAMLNIDGADMPTPSALRLTLFDAADAPSRSASGSAVRDRLALKRRLDLSWARLTQAQLALLFQAVSGAFFTLRYPDPQSGGARTASFYCGDRAAGVLRMADGAPVWTGVEMSWIER